LGSSKQNGTTSEAKSLAASATGDMDYVLWRDKDGIPSAIDFLAVSDAEDQHNQTVIFGLEPAIINAVFPELSKLRAVQGLSDAARIIQLGDSLAKEPQDALGLLRVEFPEFSVR
jgi:hypothetical protein